MSGKFNWIFLLAASFLLFGCAEEQAQPIEVTATALCQPIGQDASGVEFQECEVEASDARLSSTVTLTYTALQTETWEGTLKLTNDEGTWIGAFAGARDGPAAVSEAELIGQGPYEGLIFDYTSTNPSVEHDGSGQNEIVGTIETSA